MERGSMREPGGKGRASSGTAAVPRAATRSKRKSEATRKRVLDAAARVFRQKGYAATRLSDIAAAAGMQTGSLYYHFESREALVEEMLRIGTTSVFGYVREKVEALPRGASHRARICAAIEGHLSMMLALSDYTSANVRIFAQVPDDIKKRHLEQQALYGQYWRKLLADAHAAGEIRRDISLPALRMLLLGSLNWSVEWYRPGGLTPERIAAELGTIVFDGIAHGTPTRAAAIRAPKGKR